MDQSLGSRGISGYKHLMSKFNVKQKKCVQEVNLTQSQCVHQSVIKLTR